MGRVKFWKPEIADAQIDQIGMEKLVEVANLLRTEVRFTLNRQIRDHYYSRPMYQSGDYKGRWWTARDAGTLLKSVRVVKDDKLMRHGYRNVWVIAGNSKAYYAPMYEYSKDPKRGQKYFRPSVASAMPKMRAALKGK